MRKRTPAVIDLARKPRLPIPLDDELGDWLEELADREQRDKANMVIVLLKATQNLMKERGFKLVEGKLVKIELLSDREED